MRIRRACNPEGPGLRGLVTANSSGRGTVPRGAVALVATSAPAGTRFTTFRWAGSLRRRDCRYALQLYAEGPGIKPIALKNVRANQRCPRRARAQAAGYRSRTFNVDGATRIVQRDLPGRRRAPLVLRARGQLHPHLPGRVRHRRRPAADRDDRCDTPLATGVWVGGSQPLNYAADDNVGIRQATVDRRGQVGRWRPPSVALARPEGCSRPGCRVSQWRRADHGGHAPLNEGTQALVVQAQDTAGNTGDSAPVTARIDNCRPAASTRRWKGDQWRNSNDFALAWTNPTEVDRAPIAAAAYKLCSAGAGSCNQGEQAGEAISRLAVQAPGPGEWTVSVWRRDAAGNADPAAASVPVTLRFDPEPPQLAFESPSASDPTLVAAQVTDKVSGLAEGAIEISQTGSNVWQTLATQKDGSRLIARIDDAALPAGDYVLRATARDQARNEASTTSGLTDSRWR